MNLRAKTRLSQKGRGGLVVFGLEAGPSVLFFRLREREKMTDVRDDVGGIDDVENIDDAENIDDVEDIDDAEQWVVI